MKLTVLCSLLLVFQVGAVQLSNAQKRVSLDLQNVTLEDFFTELRRQTGNVYVFNMDDITNFLYLIGSVFAPMIAVQLTTYFILKKDSFAAAFDWPNLIVWAIGLAVYRLMMHVDLPTGYTLPSVLITMALCYAVNRLIPARK